MRCEGAVTHVLVHIVDRKGERQVLLHLTAFIVVCCLQVDVDPAERNMQGWLLVVEKVGSSRATDKGSDLGLAQAFGHLHDAELGLEARLVLWLHILLVVKSGQKNEYGLGQDGQLG